jgi:hypothetical protein
MHHFCSHDVCRSLGIVEDGIEIHEFRDVCFCSKKCYYHSLAHSTPKVTTNDNSPALEPQVASTPTISLLDYAGTLAQFDVEETIPGPTSSSQDLLLQKMVAFCPLHESWMNSKLYTSVGAAALIRTVSRARKVKKTGESEYQVIWSTTDLQSKKCVHWLDAAKIREGVVRYEQCTGNRFNDETWANLCKPESFMEELT